MPDKLFYVIYNAYYKHGRYKGGHPLFTVSRLFTFAIFAPIFTLVHVVFHKKASLAALSYLAVSGIVVYLLFIHKKRYITIYEKYRNEEKLNSGMVKIAGFVLIFTLMFSPIIAMLSVSRIKTGHWVQWQSRRK